MIRTAESSVAWDPAPSVLISPGGGIRERDDYHSIFTYDVTCRFLSARGNLAALNLPTDAPLPSALLERDEARSNRTLQNIDQQIRHGTHRPSPIFIWSS